jgi:protein-tyrosine-phosphatase
LTFPATQPRAHGEPGAQADYIFGMTHGHVDTIGLLYPAAAEKTFLLREFDESLDPFEKDISDPIGSPYDVYVHCRKQIEQGIASRF